MLFNQQELLRKPEIFQLYQQLYNQLDWCAEHIRTYMGNEKGQLSTYIGALKYALKDSINIKEIRENYEIEECKDKLLLFKKIITAVEECKKSDTMPKSIKFPLVSYNVCTDEKTPFDVKNEDFIAYFTNNTSLLHTPILFPTIQQWETYYSNTTLGFMESDIEIFGFDKEPCLELVIKNSLVISPFAIVLVEDYDVKDLYNQKNNEKSLTNFVSAITNIPVEDIVFDFIE
jgi:hypothetical protein